MRRTSSGHHLAVSLCSCSTWGSSLEVGPTLVDLRERPRGHSQHCFERSVSNVWLTFVVSGGSSLTRGGRHYYSPLKVPGARGRWPHDTVTLRVEALPDHFVTNEVDYVATAFRLDEVEAD